MAEEEKTIRSRELSYLEVVGVVLVVLKLLSIEPVASWSWVWALCPFWIDLAIDIVLFLLKRSRS